jgi:hypothetical protein
VHTANGIGEATGRDILQEVAGRTGLQRAAQIPGPRERRQDDHARRPRHVAHRACKLEPGHLRHFDVGDDHVGLEPANLLEGIGAVGPQKGRHLAGLQRE